MQIDFLLAYLQARMRERVFVEFPEAWKAFLPEHLHKFIGRPVRLKRALYGYNYSGRFLVDLASTTPRAARPSTSTAADTHNGQSLSLEETHRDRERQIQR